MDRNKIAGIARKWLGYFKGSEFDPSAEKPEMGKDLLSVGFISSWGRLTDMGQEFACAMERDARTNAGKIADIQTLGDTILAKQRSYRMDYVVEVDRDWFIAAYERLIELCGGNANGQNRGKP